MIVSLIAAMDENRVIGSGDGFIPWDLPRDKEHFRSYTAGRWMLLGRTTYEEMEGWFTTQVPVVVTSRADYPARRVAHSVPEAVAMARRNGATELVVGGGGALFASALPHADRLVLTRIDGTFDVTEPVYFPEFESSGEWRPTYRETWMKDRENPHSSVLQIWDKQVLASDGMRR